MFARFSTVQGPRGSAGTVRDVRGFAAKSHTRHGNYDLVGNDMPVFFIQDAIKFPDFVHAVETEPHNEIPTGGSAHGTFWDFCPLQPESTHMLMWAMSGRAIPCSFRMMQGFGAVRRRQGRSKDLRPGVVSGAAGVTAARQAGADIREGVGPDDRVRLLPVV